MEKPGCGQDSTKRGKRRLKVEGGGNYYNNDKKCSRKKVEAYKN